ncbi:hypothetical protein ACVWXO_008833 [Bradyrhizobium sp. LM2.7]
MKATMRSERCENVVKHLAVECRDGGGRAHHDQHLVLARTDRDLLERAGRQDVALLELFAGAPRERRPDHSCGHDHAPARKKAAPLVCAQAVLISYRHCGTDSVPLRRARR